MPSSDASTNPSDSACCRTCPSAGTTQNDSGGNCEACEPGKFQTAESVADGSGCMECGAGFQPETASGTYHGEAGADACAPCGPGKYKSAVNDNNVLLGNRLFRRNPDSPNVEYTPLISCGADSSWETVVGKSESGKCGGMIDANGWEEIFDHILHIGAHGGLQFDADGDGAKDLLAFRTGRNTLYQSDGSAPGGFVEVEADSHGLVMTRASLNGALSSCCNSRAGLVFDVDGDGYDDVFIVTDYRDPNQLWLRNPLSTGMLDRYTEVERFTHALTSSPCYHGSALCKDAFDTGKTKTQKCVSSGCKDGHATSVLLLQDDELMYITNYKGPNQLYRRNPDVADGWDEVATGTHPLVPTTIPDPDYTGGYGESGGTDFSNKAMLLDADGDGLQDMFVINGCPDGCPGATLRRNRLFLRAPSVDGGWLELRGGGGSSSQVGGAVSWTGIQGGCYECKVRLEPNQRAAKGYAEDCAGCVNAHPLYVEHCLSSLTRLDH